MIPLTIEIMGVRSRIVGNLPDDVVAYLMRQLSYEVKGSYFSGAVEKGGWDGRKYLFTARRHEFPTGLAARVIEVLRVIGYEAVLFDARTLSDPTQMMPRTNAIKLFPYQEEAVQKAIEYKVGMLRIATGGGKTIIGVEIMSRLERPAIFLVHRRDLLHQAKNVLCGYTDDLGKKHEGVMMFPELVGQVGGGVYEPNLITVMTVQSACAALGLSGYKDTDGLSSPIEPIPHKAETIVRECLEGAEVLILDEAHHAPADTIYDIVQSCKNTHWRIGLSATDWRDDNADLYIEAATGPRLVNISLSDLIDIGQLVPVYITITDIEYQKPSGWGATTETWSTVYKNGITHNDKLNAAVLAQNETWYNAGRTILTLVRSISHGIALKKSHKARGIPTVFLSGSDNAEYRSQVLDRVRRGELRHLIATSIADEGLDLPRLDALNLAGGGKSSTNAYQRIGRVIRTFPGKTEGLVADYRVKDGLWLERHAEIRERIYKHEKGFFIK